MDRHELYRRGGYAPRTGKCGGTSNPRKIIIGGTLGDTGPLLTKLISREVEKRAMATPLQAVTIEQGLPGNRAAALGAACLPLRHKLELVLRRIHT
ncbi:MAG: hypothetical protein LBD47_10085 [Treponema sp.]|nr:hypothetical protein [Treponema sp.]